MTLCQFSGCEPGPLFRLPLAVRERLRSEVADLLEDGLKPLAFDAGLLSREDGLLPLALDAGLLSREDGLHPLAFDAGPLSRESLTACLAARRPRSQLLSRIGVDGRMAELGGGDFRVCGRLFKGVPVLLFGDAVPDGLLLTVGMALLVRPASNASEASWTGWTFDTLGMSRLEDNQ